MIFILFLQICLYSYQTQTQDLQPLSYSILNRGQDVRINLCDYFQFSSQFQIVKQKSSPNISETLNIDIDLNKFQIESSELMVAKINQTQINLSEYKILNMETIYDQPNKFLLLQKNIIMMYSYRDISELSKQNLQSAKYRRNQKNEKKTTKSESKQSNQTTDKFMFIQKVKNFILKQQFKIIKQNKERVMRNNQSVKVDYPRVTAVNISSDSRLRNLNCSKIQVVQTGNTYKLLALCPQINPPNVYIVAYNLMQDSKGFVTKLNFSQNVQIPENPSSKCERYNIKYFEKIRVLSSTYLKSTIIYCNKNTSTPNSAYIMRYNQKTQFGIGTIFNPRELIICLLNSNYVTQFQNGFASVIGLNIYKFSYSQQPNSPNTCGPLFNQSVYDLKFISARNESGVQSIYMIFPDKIFIFQSYSPNYQTLKLSDIDQGLNLISYTISKNFLGLHYKNPQTNQSAIYIYNIKAIYPHLTDKIQFIDHGSIFLLSMLNYLEKGNYFFVYNQTSNWWNLTYYKGIHATISVKSFQNAIGNFQIYITNQTNSSSQQSICLPIFLMIRGFSDTSISKLNSPDLVVSNNIFNIDLAKAVIGPLGRFYKMSNQFASLQFINSFNEIKALEIINYFPNQKLLTSSVNTKLLQPILTFYYTNNNILNCQLDFDDYLLKFQIKGCTKIVNIDTKINVPKQIIIIAQDKFIQHEGHELYLCKISSNQDQCQRIDFFEIEIQKIKLIDYRSMDNGLEVISIFIIMRNSFYQRDYVKRTSISVSYQISANLEVDGDQIEYLTFMDIKTIQYDQEFKNFMLVYMVQKSLTNPQIQGKSSRSKGNDRLFHKLLIYAKPNTPKNISSHFIGHLIHEFQSFQLQNVLILNNRLIIITKSNNQDLVEEFMIDDYFKWLYVRKYPLYGHIIVKDGFHTVTNGFLFVQAISQPDKSSIMLVYKPSLNTTNILTHTFAKKTSGTLSFTQNIIPSENVMGFNGDFLFTLSLPSLIFQLKNKKAMKLYHQQQKSVKVSFIDNNNILKIIQTKFVFDNSASIIDFNPMQKLQVQVSKNTSFSFTINPADIVGPVAQYDLVTSNCPFLKFNESDIFTKTQCLKYYNSKEDGIMQDFITFKFGVKEPMSLIVTDSKILCSQKKIIQEPKLNKPKTRNCQIFSQFQIIFIVCDEQNRTTIHRLIAGQSCNISVIPIPNPSWLTYAFFKMQYSNSHAIFQVPIRYRFNKIYYKTIFYPFTNDFCTNRSILKRQSQQQFISKDFSMSSQLVVLLQDGIGIFNVSKTDSSSSLSKISPAFWITQKDLSQFIKCNEDLVYVNVIEHNPLIKEIILQLGTSLTTFQLFILYGFGQNGTFLVLQFKILYTYNHPWSCYNTLISQSQRFQNMTIKICSFIPEQHYVFSNFIPISQKQKNTYIIFYQKHKNQTSSYPFRMDIIYTNIYSNDNFQIADGNLIVGSLFNLLCYYYLEDKYTFTLEVKKEEAKQYQEYNLFAADGDDFIQCQIYLNLSNQNFQLLYPISVRYQVDSDGSWTDFKFWVQRIIFLVIVLNYIRLHLRDKKKQEHHRKIQKNFNIFSHQFQLKVKMNSKKSL